MCIINFGDEDVYLYPENVVGIMQEEKIILRDIQTGTAQEAICEVDEGEEAGFFSELVYADKATEGNLILSSLGIVRQVVFKYCY